MRTYVNINKVISIVVVVGFGIWMVKKSIDASKASKELEEYKKTSLDKIDEAIDDATIKNDKIESPADRAMAREVLYSMKDEIRHASTTDDVDTALRRFRDTCDGFLNNNQVVTLSMIEFHKKRIEKAATEVKEAKAEALKKEEIQAYMSGFRDIIRTVGVYM